MAQQGVGLASIQPKVTITIENDGVPSQNSANVRNGEVIAFKAAVGAPSDWLIQFQDMDETSPFPLTTFVPKNGDKSYVVVDYDGIDDDTIQFVAEAYPSAGVKKRKAMAGKYTIIINGGGRDEVK